MEVLLARCDRRRGEVRSASNSAPISLSAWPRSVSHWACSSGVMSMLYLDDTATVFGAGWRVHARVVEHPNDRVRRRDVAARQQDAQSLLWVRDLLAHHAELGRDRLRPGLGPTPGGQLRRLAEVTWLRLTRLRVLDRRHVADQAALRYERAYDAGRLRLSHSSGLGTTTHRL